MRIDVVLVAWAFHGSALPDPEEKESSSPVLERVSILLS